MRTTRTKPYDRPEEFRRSAGDYRIPFITATLSTDPCGGKPYFSLTGEIGFRGARDCETCGQIPEEILRHWPDLAPFAALHLSDLNGVPMHAESNGFYWLAGAAGGLGQDYHGGNARMQHWLPGKVFNGYRESTPDECLEIFARHCRVSLGEARQIVRTVAASPTPKATWRVLMNEMRPRWKEEADAALTQFFAAEVATA